MSFAKRIGHSLAPKVVNVAPQFTASMVRQALDKAISGVAVLPGAARAAETALETTDGDRNRAIRLVVRRHIRYAGAQGFLTNVGGLVTATVTVPANLVGLAMVECRMAAAILHLRGYDLADPRTRAAILVSLLDEDTVNGLIKHGKIPGTPMAIATAPVADPGLVDHIANLVATDLLGSLAGKRMVGVVGRRMPVLGGAVGAAADGWDTWKLGRYVRRDVLPRGRQ